MAINCLEALASQMPPASCHEILESLRCTGWNWFPHLFEGLWVVHIVDHVDVLVILYIFRSTSAGNRYTRSDSAIECGHTVSHSTIIVNLS